MENTLINQLAEASAGRLKDCSDHGDQPSYERSEHIAGFKNGYAAGALTAAAASPAPAVAGEAGQWVLEKTKTRFHIEKGHNGINGIFWALHAKVKTLVQAEERVASYREGWPDFDLWRIAEVSITKHKKQTAAAPTTQQKSQADA